MIKALGGLFNSNQREIRRLEQRVKATNDLEPQVAALADEALAAKTGEFKGRLERGEEIDSLLPEAFAVVREAARRALGQRPFDVQVMGGIVLHEGRIAEMKTGEGKTLVATMPVYLNALLGRGVHVVTVNDYLARRDSEWMGKIYRFLGLDVGLIVHGLDPVQRQRAYRADLTYGTNNEYGFDYLRDNMVHLREHMVQRDLYYAIVDEVDCILIDEARTPLIISGPSQKSPDLYHQYARAVRSLKGVKVRGDRGRDAEDEGEPDADYEVDEKAHTVSPTEKGMARVERLVGVRNIHDERHMQHMHYLTQALRAQGLMKRDRDYVVKDGQVIIVDEFTGRLMFGRRFSDGLHQAIEAQEGLKIQQENQTVATVTFQNYFRMYKKLAGMTGTAATEEDEFIRIYNMEVVVIPTHMPMIRTDLPDAVYRGEAGKFRAVVEDIVERHRQGQPVLVGTISVEKSEILSDMLSKRGIAHNVLNAKHHEKEAQIVALAGQPGAVTIATNMAGRGTDIVLGEGIAGGGGLCVLGTERHEARRIDNQLRGRSGRQGDPGCSRFYLSLEDDLMRLFGADFLGGLLDRLGMREDEAIEHPLVTRAIEMAQKRVEARHFDARRHVLEYDDVMNRQREVIYRQRRQVLGGEDLKPHILKMVEAVVEHTAAGYAPEVLPGGGRDWSGLLAQAEELFLEPGYVGAGALEGLNARELKEALCQAALECYERREQALGAEVMRELERRATLFVVDTAWMDHLASMDDLKEGIGLRAYGQQDPLLEYRREGFEMFERMIASIQEYIVRMVYRAQVTVRPAVAAAQPVAQAAVAAGAGAVAAAGVGAAGGGAVAGGAMAAGAGGAGAGMRPPTAGGAPGAGLAAGGAPGALRAVAGQGGGGGSTAPAPRPGGRVGRNDPCPCGSGKKYKKCCGQ